MKRIIRLLLAAFVVSVLAGCGSSVNTKQVSEYLENASIDTSALAFYSYDGSTTTVRFLFDKGQKMEIINNISKLKATPVADWSLSKGDIPFYGVEIYGDDDYLSVLFAGGHVILGDGRVYEMNYSFQGYDGKYAWSETEYYGGMYMPCSHYAVLGQTGWKKELMNESDRVVNERLVVKEIFSLDKTVEVEITNNMGMDWSYGEYYDFEVLIDDTWYKVPIAESYAVNDIAYILPMGETQTRKYDLGPFGELPNGRYRLIIDGADVSAAMNISVD